MIRGWRNDPRWVEFYAKREFEREQRQIKRIQEEILLQQLIEESEASMRRIKWPTVKQFMESKEW